MREIANRIESWRWALEHCIIQGKKIITLKFGESNFLSKGILTVGSVVFNGVEVIAEQTLIGFVSIVTRVVLDLEDESLREV